MLADFVFAGLGAGKAMMPVGLCGLAVEGHGGGPSLMAGVDIDNAVAGLVGDLHGTARDVEFAGGSKAHHSASSHSSA